MFSSITKVRLVMFVMLAYMKGVMTHREEEIKTFQISLASRIIRNYTRLSCVSRKKVAVANQEKEKTSCIVSRMNLET